ncbi:hypothetical protein L228DRAFT_267644 [Xylona heveae TC161]|uniref:Cell wall proline rich protein n=1 Tax=Xylona heveae (strain CBS 132557 / TC161) TaxID=1328760 RepID=A0A165HKV2_XYLHT|nr:hypothetical protein L228DRAFT_267644 [Xylona heveae TC161]KZF23665.1 hypothetical protein L228DRAFT_267644 [Xylona heveae TC161]
MAEVSLARQQAYSALHDGGSRLEGQFPADSIVSPPAPNPPFVFPARDDRLSIEDTRPFSYNALRPSENIASQIPNRSSMGAVPDFVFHPSPSQPARPSTSDTLQAPNLGVPIPSRPGGHRRSGSEFIGVNGPGGLLSASPTGGMNSFSLPAPPARPTAGKRGHAHRRSGAISCHDLSSLALKPTDSNIDNRAGSAPTTPSGLDANKSFETCQPFSFPQAQPTVPTPDRPSSPTAGPQQQRARVGFSDTLEYIPRPPSTVSSEASSTLSPRFSHSVSGSCSSQVLGSMGSPRSKAGRSSPQAQASDISTSHNNDRLANNLSNSPTMSSSNSSPRLGRPATPRFTTSDMQEDNGSGNASQQTPATATAPELILLPSPPESPLPSPSSEPEDEAMDESMSYRDSKVQKKEKRVKSWAGSILPRKSRHRDQKLKPSDEPIEAPSILSYDLSEPPTGVISESLNEEYTYSNWKPKEIPSSSSDAMSPIIDLDAALGPFKSPGDDLGPEFRRPLNGGFQVAKRRMHSSGKTGGFTGPGMHYHRRAESAPEMVAFDFNRSELDHTGSTMQDVFEEDEETDEGEGSSNTRSVSSPVTEEKSEEKGLGIDLDVDTATDVANTPAEPVSPLSKPQPAYHSADDPIDLNEGTILESEAIPSATPLYDEEGFNEVGLSETPGQFESTRPSPFRESASRHRIGVSLETGQIREGARSVSVPERLGLPMPSAPFLAPETPSSISSFSRRSFDQQSANFDVSRHGTAASSVAECTTLSSLVLGEPGPEFCSSIDDVPSLTNSDSTMASALQGQLPGSAHSGRCGERSVSISSSKTGGHSRLSLGRKRSSLASLSKLVSRSSFERSKLSLETREHSGNVESSKSGKSRRFSRMMSFWKPKEASAL